jgi:hypothetical protein
MAQFPERAKVVIIGQGGIVKRTGALDVAMRSAQSEIQRALDASKHLPAGPYVDCMVQLAQQSLVRSS